MPTPTPEPVLDASDVDCDETLAGENGVEYKGCQTKTRGGHECQAWTAQAPHDHHFTTADFYGETIEAAGNKCRNPDNDETIWCYTTDPNQVWEFCDPVADSSDVPEPAAEDYTAEPEPEATPAPVPEVTPPAAAEAAPVRGRVFEREGVREEIRRTAHLPSHNATTLSVNGSYRPRVRRTDVLEIAIASTTCTASMPVPRRPHSVLGKVFARSMSESTLNLNPPLLVAGRRVTERVHAAGRAGMSSTGNRASF